MQHQVGGVMFPPLYEARTWMKVLAGIWIAGGVLQCLTIIGIIVGWIPILLAYRLWTAATAMEDAVTTNDEWAAAAASECLASVFTIGGIVTVVGIGLYLLAFLGFLLIGLAGIAAGA